MYDAVTWLVVLIVHSPGEKHQRQDHDTGDQETESIEVVHGYCRLSLGLRRQICLNPVVSALASQVRGGGALGHYLSGDQSPVFDDKLSLALYLVKTWLQVLNARYSTRES
jgi:hypothetical protein